MNHFVCERLRLCNYLIERGFYPVQTMPDRRNPRFSVFLFEETPELTAAVVQYFSTDCLTAQKKRNGVETNEYDKKKKRG